MASLNDQIQQIVESKILETIDVLPAPFTRRDISLPSIKNKAKCVIGMRRAGKTTFLHQCRGDLIQAGQREAMAEHPTAKPLLLTLVSRLPEPEVPKPIRLMPAWKWMRE